MVVERGDDPRSPLQLWPTGRVYDYRASSSIQAGISIRVAALNSLTLSWIASICASSSRMIPRTSGLSITAIAELDSVIARLGPVLGVQTIQHLDHALQFSQLEDVFINWQIGPLDRRLDDEQPVLELTVAGVLGPDIDGRLTIIISEPDENAVVSLDVIACLRQPSAESVLDRECLGQGQQLRVRHVSGPQVRAREFAQGIRPAIPDLR